jgi:hypothetical protein
MVVMLMQRRQSGGRLGIPHLILFLLSTFRSRHHRIRACLVGWMVQECANVMNK